MKTVEELNLGFSDAQNYMQRGNKQMFADIFVKNRYLDKLLHQNVYFLIGEKGTGKTAYATYLTNSEYEGSKSILKFVQTTDYEKFHELKKTGKIDISGYTDIWKIIILLLIAKSITDNDRVLGPFNKTNLPDLLNAINMYYNDAFSPEIVNVLKIVDKSEYAAQLICKYASIGGGEASELTFTEQRLQMNLTYIYNKFSSCLGKLKLNKNFTLYIDGIDVRPNQIPYNEYIDCIKGLTTACWTLNTELFSNIRDSKGHFRVVLLLRPDIFHSLNLQNATNKLSDNSVFLEWRTTYEEYKSSDLYQMANKLLRFDQPDLNEDIWESYFKWPTQHNNYEQKTYTAFKLFLKISLSRPRDIQQILKILQEIMQRKNISKVSVFSKEVYDSDEFQNSYSEYFLGSLKDQLAFYYSEKDYKHFIKFFDFFDNPQFSFKKYFEIYEKFTEYLLNNAEDLPEFVEDRKKFIQFLYDSNIITAIKDDGYGKKYFYFSYREKSPTNLAPDVPYYEGIEYCFHYGLYKKSKLGRF